MKKVVRTPTVDFALSSLRPEEFRRIDSVLGHLANWDGDPFLHEHSSVLPDVPDVRVYRTSSDYWIFFKIDGETITILEVAKRESILRTFAH